MKKTIPLIDIAAPFGDDPLDIFCPICGQKLTEGEELNPCEHCLAVYFDGWPIATNELGNKIFEEDVAPHLFSRGIARPNEMLATGSNFILSHTTGGMACGPVWESVEFIFEAYPETLLEKSK